MWRIAHGTILHWMITLNHDTSTKMKLKINDNSKNIKNAINHQNTSMKFTVIDKSI